MYRVCVYNVLTEAVSMFGSHSTAITMTMRPNLSPHDFIERGG